MSWQGYFLQKQLSLIWKNLYLLRSMVAGISVTAYEFGGIDKELRVNGITGMKALRAVLQAREHAFDQAVFPHQDFGRLHGIFPSFERCQ